MTQIAQTAVCYRHHSIEQQLARWLLSTADRLPEGELVMTQELVAGLLGVRRESVTDAAGRLRDAVYIRSRSHWTANPNLRVLRRGQEGTRVEKLALR